MPKTYTVEQIARVLQVRKGYVYDLIYTGQLKAIRLSERRFRISENALQEFITTAEQEFANTFGLLQEVS